MLYLDIYIPKCLRLQRYDYLLERASEYADILRYLHIKVALRMQIFVYSTGVYAVFQPFSHWVLKYLQICKYRTISVYLSVYIQIYRRIPRYNYAETPVSAHLNTLLPGDLDMQIFMIRHKYIHLYIGMQIFGYRCI